MTKEEKIKNFNPNGVGLKNGNFIGLPFDENDAQVVLLPVPWDVTVSFGDGTSTGPENILNCSAQLDLVDTDVKNAWKMGVFMRQPDKAILDKSKALRKKAVQYIDAQEKGAEITEKLAKIQDEINAECAKLKNWVYDQCNALLDNNKIVGVVGGDHSVPLGLIQALAERHKNIGILHIDAHLDLRLAYEGFDYSHASIFQNALTFESISKMVSVGIRDYCDEEKQFVKLSGERMNVFYDHKIKNALYEGVAFAKIAKEIVKCLPKKVYVSFDIDGLEPNLCPNTGTPVPGGLALQEAFYLLKTLVDSGRKIVGFDLSEVAGVGNDWDGNVGARVLYKLANLAGKSNDLI